MCFLSGAMDIHKAIGKLPRPRKGFVLPNHKYTGPYNPLHHQLNESDLPIVGQEPYNKVDEISMRHDICYRDHPTDKKGCDEVMLKELDTLQPANWRESVDKNVVRGVIATKNKYGLGMIKWTNELADELHRPVRKKFKKRFVFVQKAKDIFAADLIDLRSHSKENQGYKYVLMVIDVFSKFGWAVPLKTKTASAVAEALESIFENETPKKLWVDEGGEFYNKVLDKILKKRQIEIYSTHNDEKCSVVERWNRTIKTQLWKYFSANGTYKYLDILQPLIDKYNNTRHHSTGFTPIDAKKPKNHDRVFRNLYFKKMHSKRISPKLKLGDQVRITRKKPLFDKGYTMNWTHKTYTIAKVLTTNPPTYKIKDDKGIIEGSFYEPELQKTGQDLYLIENVLGWKMINGKRYGRVKWKGYDSSYNTWEPEEEIRHLRDL